MISLSYHVRTHIVAYYCLGKATKPVRHAFPRQRGLRRCQSQGINIKFLEASMVCNVQLRHSVLYG